jgi:hypothetical protein
MDNTNATPRGLNDAQIRALPHHEEVFDAYQT